MNNDGSAKIVLPKQERSIRTKEQILEAATKMFSERGLHGTRIDDITRECGINRERIYAYFGSKQRLYTEVLLSSYSQIAYAESMKELRESDIEKLPELLIDAFIDFHQTHPDFWRLLAWENLYGGKHLSAAKWKLLRGAYISHLKALYRKGQSRGVFRRDVDFNTYIFTVFSVTFFYFSNRLTLSNLLDVDFGNESVRKKTQKQLIRLINEGVRTG